MNFIKIIKLIAMPTIQLTLDKFQSEVFDYEKDLNWKYRGKLPAIIDFYADWCAPCKAIAPVLEELSEEYKDQLIIYKVDTESEEELSGMFSIRSIPTLIFIPMDKEPMMRPGALYKSDLVQIIEDELV